MAEQQGDPQEKRRPPVFEHGEKLAHHGFPAPGSAPVEARRPLRGLAAAIWALLAIAVLAWMIWQFMVD